MIYYRNFYHSETKFPKLQIKLLMLYLILLKSGDITKEEALTILTDNKLLPVANWICLPDFMDDYDYFSRYSTIYYMDYMYPQNFGNHEYASWSEMSYEEGINELYDFVEGNRVIGCIYDWRF